MRPGARALALAALLLAAPSALAEAKRPLGAADRIDLNRAGVTELMRLPGVGEKRAQAIVAARAKQPFRKPEDVLVVKGIGPRWLARVRANVIVGTPAPAVAARPGS
ncbi:MAG TPA: helix-hairpin-helix domain-containing protein [Anaeromyxobacter sp.]|nr:helix-hairpin-helix domain-containing protein [Anaeromyxobacter sp.]